MAGKKFRFSLSQVLQVRTHETDRARKALAAAIQQRITQEKRVDDASEALTRLQEDQAAGTPLPATAFRQADGLRLDARRRLRAEQQRLRQCLREEQQARRELVNRHQAQEALVTLKNIEHQRFQQAEHHADLKRLEEQALDAFRRKNAS